MQTRHYNRETIQGNKYEIETWFVVTLAEKRDMDKAEETQLNQIHCP